MTLAKALANGLPMGAMLATGTGGRSLRAGFPCLHFRRDAPCDGGIAGRLAPDAGKDIPETCRNTGAYFFDRLLRLKKRHPVIEEVRGMGLLLGMKLNVDAEPVVLECLERVFSSIAFRATSCGSFRH